MEKKAIDFGKSKHYKGELKDFDQSWPKPRVILRSDWGHVPGPIFGPKLAA